MGRRVSRLAYIRYPTFLETEIGHMENENRFLIIDF